MNDGGAKTHRLLLIGALALLLAVAAGVVLAQGEGAAAPGPEAASEESAAGSCCGCCARAVDVADGAGCGRAGEGGCCGAMRGPRHGRGGGPGYGCGLGAGAGAGYGAQRGPKQGRGAAMGCSARRGAGRGHGARAGGSALMPTIRSLVHDHRQEIERTVEEVENGVVTVTRAPRSAEAAEAIRQHVRQAKQLLESGGRIRMWDPLFRELMAHADQITMEIEELEDGMRVTETSNDPQVAQLIQAHARKVSEFIERGPAAVHEETPLPEGYEAAS